MCIKWYYKYKSKVFKLLFIAFIPLQIFIIYKCKSLMVNYTKPLPKIDLSCYDITEDDLLQSNSNMSKIYIEKEAGRRRIFFHETSCRKDLTPRQACAVESAARANPNWTVLVLFTGVISADYEDSENSILSFPNVKLKKVFLAEYVKSTPLEKIISKNELERSLYRVSHTSDVLRFATLYNYPGVYLDLDMIVVRSLDSLSSNFVIRESDWAISAGILAFGDDEAGRNFSRAAAEELGTTFNGDVWGYNGPGVIKRVLRHWCNTSNVLLMNEKICKGISVYQPAYAYPLHWTQAKAYFELGRLSSSQTNQTYMHHTWGHVSGYLIPDKDSPYHELAKRYCPSVYSAFKSEFGWTAWSVDQII